jgi:hypothetical protein
MRSALYWLTSTLVAVLCAKAAATPHTDLEVVASTVPRALGGSANDLMRAVLLAIGIMAVAYTYRRVWLNFRSS